MGFAHMEGPAQPERYAAAARAAAEAMRKVSPDLVLCSSGPYQHRERAAEWVERSARALAPAASFISLHTYNNICYDFTGPEGIRRAYTEAVAAAAANRETLMALRAVTPEGMHISYDEWNLWAAWFRRSCSLEGMFAAQMLHTMLHAGSAMDAPIMCYFQPVGEGAVDVFPDRAELSADGHCIGVYVIINLCQLSVQVPPQ